MTRSWSSLAKYAMLALAVHALLSHSSRVISETSEGKEYFRNPLRPSGADPWVMRFQEEYYVTFTTGRNITLLRTDKMSEIGMATEKVIWNPPKSGMNSKHIWAPEIHRINNSWYVYYAASDVETDNHRMWVLRNKAADPFEDSWEDLGTLELPDDKWAIDGTVLQLNDKMYYAWSGWEGDTNVQQDLFIAEMESPTSVVGKRFKIHSPLKDWEINDVRPRVVEGPQFLVRNGRIFLFYSAGGCWKDEYSIGFLWMDAEQPVLDPNSWNYFQGNPVFTSNASGGTFGPGHNSFFRSKDGKEDWLLYHANPNPGDGCRGRRSMRMQPFTWDDSGFPLLGKAIPLTQKLVRPGGE